MDFLLEVKNKQYIFLEKLLAEHKVKTQVNKNRLSFSHGTNQIEFLLAGEDFDPEKHVQKAVIHEDQLIRGPEKIAAMILSKLKLNKTIFARSCEVKKTDKITTTDFLNKFHIMNSTQSALNLGLYFKEELIGIATFSKGRKMNRLEEDQRSFELIRFCCKSGITVTGGLTRLVKSFCTLKKAGDIMTYVDKQLSDGRSFITAGFKKHSETDPNYFLVNRKTFERISAAKEEKFDHEKFYLTKNAGSIKLVFTPGE